MAQNKRNICNQTFNREQELHDHQRTAHGTGKKEGQPPRGAGSAPRQDCVVDKISAVHHFESTDNLSRNAGRSEEGREGANSSRPKERCDRTDEVQQDEFASRRNAG
jgi:hypothetical protein